MNITSKLKAGYPGIYIVTHEEVRAESMLRKTAKDLGWHIFGWTVAAGRFDIESGETHDEDAQAVLRKFVEPVVPEKSLLVLKDYHAIITMMGDPMLFRLLKDALFLAKTQNKCLIILAPVLTLPKDVEKLFAVIDLPLPDRDELKVVLKAVCEGNDKPVPKGDALLAALDAARGLTSTEAEDAFALSIVESGKIDPQVIAREKAETIRKNGILEVVKPDVGINDIGGLDLLKAWLQRRKNAFGDEAIKFNLPTPKGILITGPPGTGKSLTAKATASIFGNLPLLRLDAGSIFAKHVGESEANVRAVTKLAEAIAPCVLWIDELEKGFQKGDGGESDGGTSSRVFGTLLQWMNDKTAPVFIVATSNDVTKLDSALVRKGRFDEIFFVDLPNELERKATWEIQIGKYGRDASNFDLAQLAHITDTCTGAEIEAMFSEALYTAFDNDREPNMLDIVEQITPAAGGTGFIPLAKTMSEDVERLRKWSKGRARLASSTIANKVTRKLASS